MEELENTRENKPERDEHGRLLPGNTANPNGRPKNSFSIKDAIRKHLEENPQDFEQFVRHFIKTNRELAWQMLEGRPKQDHDVDFGFKPIPLDPNVYKDESVPEDQIVEGET